MTHPDIYNPLLDAAEALAIANLEAGSLFVFGVSLNSDREPVFYQPSDEFETFDAAYDGLRESLEQMSRAEDFGIWIVCAPVMAMETVVAVSCETMESGGGSFAVMSRCHFAEDGSVSLGERDFVRAKC